MHLMHVPLTIVICVLYLSIDLDSPRLEDRAAVGHLKNPRVAGLLEVQLRTLDPLPWIRHRQSW